MSEQIPEQRISLEELQAADIGGNAIQTLYAETLINPCKYVVKDAYGVTTQWGIRIEYIIEDSVGQFRVSSWNIVSKGKFKALDLIGKEIKLSQWANNPKKILMEVL